MVLRRLCKVLGIEQQGRPSLCCQACRVEKEADCPARREVGPRGSPSQSQSPVLKDQAVSIERGQITLRNLDMSQKATGDRKCRLESGLSYMQSVKLTFFFCLKKNQGEIHII